MTKKTDKPNAPASADVASTREDQDNQRVDPKLLELLVCPVTKTTLIYDAQKNELISKAAHLAFPIRKGIPLMTPDAARPLTDDK